MNRRRSFQICGCIQNLHIFHSQFQLGCYVLWVTLSGNRLLLPSPGWIVAHGSNGSSGNLTLTWTPRYPLCFNSIFQPVWLDIFFTNSKLHWNCATNLSGPCVLFLWPKNPCVFCGSNDCSPRRCILTFLAIWNKTFRTWRAVFEKYFQLIKYFVFFSLKKRLLHLQLWQNLWKRATFAIHRVLTLASQGILKNGWVYF